MRRFDCYRAKNEDITDGMDSTRVQLKTVYESENTGLSPSPADVLDESPVRMNTVKAECVSPIHRRLRLRATASIGQSNSSENSVGRFRMPRKKVAAEVRGGLQSIPENRELTNAIESTRQLRTVHATEDVKLSPALSKILDESSVQTHYQHRRSE